MLVLVCRIIIAFSKFFTSWKLNGGDKENGKVVYVGESGIRIDINADIEYTIDWGLRMKVVNIYGDRIMRDFFRLLKFKTIITVLNLEA